VAGLEERVVRSISLVRNAATILLLSSWIPNHSFVEPSSKSVTSAQTMSSESKDYREATRRHVEVERMRRRFDERDRFIPSAGETRGSE
jgi:hypothetical protein